MAARRLARALEPVFAPEHVLLGLHGVGAIRLPTRRASPKSPRYQPPAISKPSPIPAQVLDPYLRFAQKVIFPVDGARSAIYPTGLACPSPIIRQARHVAGGSC